MISLTNKEQAMIKNILKAQAIDQPYRVVLFGSRVTGNNRKYSDVDLAFISPRPMPTMTLSNLDEAFEESDLPYTVDVVDLHTASQAMKEQVARNGWELTGL